MHSARILFVDDEESIRLTLPPVLKEKGFEVAVSASVAEEPSLKSIQRNSTF